ncbi:MAG TPA: hypothetical protein VFM18_20940, partial [Methanosarcina sp.]|nr:hypothetical protein [Methanosarcina sp.]
MTSSIGSISFPVAQPDSVVSRPFKQVKKQITEGGKTKDVVEAWVDFGGAVSQVNTITITAGSAGNDYIIEIDDGTNSAIVSYVQQAGDTAASIAARLLEEINGVPSVSDLVSATVLSNVLTLTADLPGTALTYDVSASTTPGNIVVAQTTAASGTAKMRKISEIKSYFEIPSGGRNLVIVSQTVFYDGANPPVVVR